MEQAQVTMTPAKGKLGVLLPGMGAVSTTLIAGVELIKKGLGRPVGSVTQYGTIRLGKRTDNNTPLIRDCSKING
jgi:myo-inositol-1-phosphate synthase